MNKYRLFLFSLLIILAIFIPIASMAQVYINHLPQDITLYKGDPLVVPLFFVGKSLTGKPVEFFAWKEQTDTNEKEYLVQDTWIPFVSYEDMLPIASVESMIEYIYIPWQFYKDTTVENPFDLYVCLDGNVDGKLPDGLNTPGASCDTRKINIILNPNPVPDPCLEISVSKELIEETITKSLSPKTVQIFVRACGQDIVFDANTTENWITLFPREGILDVILDPSSLTANTTHHAIIRISYANLAPKDVSVKLKVIPPTFNF